MNRIGIGCLGDNGICIPLDVKSDDTSKTENKDKKEDSNE